VVIGLVRNKAATEAKIAKEIGRKVYVIEGELTNYDSLKVSLNSRFYEYMLTRCRKPQKKLQSSPAAWTI
jgi:hypothetical protein